MKTVLATGTLAIASGESQNRKIGDAATTYAAQTSCPSSCRFKDGGGCYAEAGSVGQFVTRPLNESAGSASPAQVALAEAHAIDELTVAEGRPMRLHTVGDCATDQAAAIVSSAAERYMERGGGPVWTYTHPWRDVTADMWGHVSVLASCETAADVEAARERGYATAIVVDKHPGSRRYDAELADGTVSVLPCPAQTRNVPCTDCRLCFDDVALRQRGYSIGFEIHGAQVTRRRARLALEAPDSPTRRDSSRVLIPALDALAAQDGREPLTDAEIAGALDMSQSSVHEMRKALAGIPRDPKRRRRTTMPHVTAREEQLPVIGTLRASDVRPKPMPLLWRERIPFGALTVIAGPPGIGKSTLESLIAAEVSQAGLAVLISNLEDDLEAVVRPRLEVADADLDLVHLIPADHAPQLPPHLPRLRDLIVQTGASLLLLDPIAAHFRPERRVHDRAILRELVHVARETGCAVVGVHHTTKRAPSDAPLEAVGGPNGGLAGTARAVYLYGYDPEDVDRRALVTLKVNGIDQPPALILEHETVGYNADGQLVEAGCLRIVDEGVISGRSAMRPGHRHVDRDAACSEWLTRTLQGYDDLEVPVRELRALAQESRWPWLTVNRAAQRIKCRKLRRGGFGGAGWWSWRLPDEHPLRQPAEDAEEAAA